MVLGDHRTSFLNGFPDSSTEQSHTRSWPGAQIEDRNKRRAGDIERFLGRSINGSGKPSCKERRIQGLEARTGTGESGKREDGRDDRPERDETAKKHEEAERRSREEGWMEILRG